MSNVLATLAGLYDTVTKRQQRRTALANPNYWDCEVSPSGHLILDGVDLVDLVKKYGSPVLCVSRRKLSDDANRFLKAATAFGTGTKPVYSYKTNCVPGVLKELHRLGFGAEVISPYELWLADKLGVPGADIIVNGVNKTQSFISEAVRLQVASINIDSPSELPLISSASRTHGKRAKVSLRIKHDQGSHFGVDVQNGEAMAVAELIRRQPDEFEFVGLHTHAVAPHNNHSAHASRVTHTLRFASQLATTLGMDTRTLNIGGGYLVPTVKIMSRWEYARQRLLSTPPHPPDPTEAMPIERNLQHLQDLIATYCRNHGLPLPQVFLEPGRTVTSQSHVLLTSVHSLKVTTIGPAFAMTDAGKLLTAYPCDYEYHQIFVANRMRDEVCEIYDLMGRLCTPTDWLAKRRWLPKLASGDVLAVMDAGAYFTSHATNFGFPRPMVLLLNNGSVTTVREEETYDHLVAMDCI